MDCNRLNTHKILTALEKFLITTGLLIVLFVSFAILYVVLIKEKHMKFNLDVTIPEVVEQCTHGDIAYKEVELSCFRATGDTIINQGEDSIILEQDQAK